LGAEDAATPQEDKRRGKERASQDMEIEEVEGDENFGEYVIGIAEMPWKPEDERGPPAKANS